MASAPAVANLYPNLINDTDKVQQIYLNALGRAATSQELETALNRLDQ